MESQSRLLVNNTFLEISRRPEKTQLTLGFLLTESLLGRVAPPDHGLRTTSTRAAEHLIANDNIARWPLTGVNAAMLDMNLNGNKSHAVADALAARGVPFIFSTGYSGIDMSDHYGDRPVLKKPFLYEALGEILTRLLSR